MRCNKRNKVNITVFSSTLIDKEVGYYCYGYINGKNFKRQRFFPYIPKGLFKEIMRDSKKYDIIHIHGLKSVDPLISISADRRATFYITVHYHPTASNLFYNILKKIYDPIFSKYILKKARRIICVSHIERILLIKRFGSVLGKKIYTIPNGVDIKQIRSAKPFSFKGKMVLYIGRIEKYKNLDIAVKCLRHLPEEFRLYIIGSGTYRNRLLQLSNKLRLTERVRILNPQPDKQVYRFLKTCSIFINLSSVEAFGISVLEALAAKKPSIVNNKLGLRELASKFEGLVRAIDLNLVNPRKLADIILQEHGKEKEVDLSEYDWDNIAQKIEKIYLESCQ